MKRTPLRKTSKKRARQNRIRREFTRQALEQHPLCAIRSPVCTQRAEALHEVLKRSAGGAIIPGERATQQGQRFIPACNRCNGYVEDQPRWALANGWAVSRFKADAGGCGEVSGEGE